MLMKKILQYTLFTLIFLVNAAFADATQDAQNSNAHLGMYIDANLGYVSSDWSSFTKEGYGAFSFLGLTPTTHEKGGFTYGLDLGYQFSLYLGLELGGFSLPKVEGDSLEVSTPYYYAVGKLIFPLYNRLALIGKLGAAYRMVRYQGEARQSPYSGNKHEIKGLYGAGLQYHVTTNFYFSGQWLQMRQSKDGSINTAKSNKQVPTMNQFFLGLGYLFTV